MYRVARGYYGRAKGRARCEAATPEEWCTPPRLEGVTSQRNGDIVFRNVLNKNIENDLLFIAHARQDIPALLDTLEEMENEKDKWIRYHEWAESISEIGAERDEANNYAQENEDYALKVESERDEWKAKFEQADRMFIAADDAASRFEEKCEILTAERDRMREALKSIKDWLHIYPSASAESVFTMADSSARRGLGEVSK